MKILIFLSTLFFSFLSLAGWPEDFEELKNRPRSYEDAGAICEELARLKIERNLPNSNYEVVVGIEYGDKQRTIGELDIVIFDRTKNSVVSISEVKCWRDMNGGLKKAKEQRMRFLTNLKSKKQIFFQSTSTEQSFDLYQFQNIARFSTIGPKGAIQSGYDDELDYQLRDLHKFSMEMIRCQDRGHCARPE